MISAKHLVKTYPDGTKAIKDVSFDINQGETYGILGPNGAGKSTVIKMLTGSLKPTGGSIIFDGQAYRSVPRDVGSQIGIMGQEIVVWDHLTTLENLKFFGEMQQINKGTLNKHAEYLLKELALWGKRDAVAYGLSGGMRRRLHLALALIQSPKVLFLDEPTPGMDVQGRMVLLNFLDKLKRQSDTTIVITSHYIEEVDKLADRVAIIDKGELVVVDTPENLKKSIGEGDVLELVLKQTINEGEFKALKAKLKKIDATAAKSDNRILVKTLDAVNKITKVLKDFDDTSCEIKSLSLRGNTLEDVFIYLTGKDLG